MSEEEEKDEKPQKEKEDPKEPIAKAETEADAEGTWETDGASSEDVEIPDPSQSAKASGELEKVDELLDTVDPNFKETIADIDSKDFDGAKIDSGDEADLKPSRLAKVKVLVASLITALAVFKDKKFTGSVVAILLVFSTLVYLVVNKMLLPKFQIPYNLSMEELTDKIHTYDIDSTTVPLFDDLRSKVFALSLPKTTILLKSHGGKPSYGTFEFFLNIIDKEEADKVKLHQTKIIDLIQQTVEKVTWDELQNPIGKAKVKKVLRLKINNYFQRNVVIGVYYRSILLSR